MMGVATDAGFPPLNTIRTAMRHDLMHLVTAPKITIAKSSMQDVAHTDERPACIASRRLSLLGHFAVAYFPPRKSGNAHKQYVDFRCRRRKFAMTRLPCCFLNVFSRIQVAIPGVMTVHFVCMKNHEYIKLSTDDSHQHDILI